jgi:hypothetical protein
MHRGIKGMGEKSKALIMGIKSRESLLLDYPVQHLKAVLLRNLQASKYPGLISKP